MSHDALYALDNIVLELQSGEVGQILDPFLRELSWMKIDRSILNPALRITVTRSNGELRLPLNCREVLREDGFLGLELDDDFYLTDGSSRFHLRPAKGEGNASIAPSFSSQSSLAQANFWCFGLLKLLRPLGIYSLHAAALATGHGMGLLLVGPSGSGKSTLAIALIREGWSYLSDDAVLLRQGSQGIEALACRRGFYIDALRALEYSDLPLGDEAVDSSGGQRRRVNMEHAYSTQYIARCFPRLVIFPQIRRQDQSTLARLNDISALRILLAQSAPQLFDRSTMAAHLELLKRLLKQTEIYELQAGTDLHREPAKLVRLIEEARGESNWCALSLS